MTLQSRILEQIDRLKELRSQIVISCAKLAIQIDPGITFSELAELLPIKVEEAMQRESESFCVYSLIPESTNQLIDEFYATLDDCIRECQVALFTDKTNVQLPITQPTTSHDISVIGDNAVIFSSPNNAMHDTQRLKGTVTITVEDQLGNVKEQQTVDNLITEAFARIMLANTFNSHLGLKALTQTNISSASTNVSNICRAEQPSTYGIFLLDAPQNLTKDSYYPPYLLPNGNEIDFKKTVFYNVNGNSSTETLQTLVPVPSRCIFDINTRMLQMEYVKNIGEGTVQNICIGRTPDSVGNTATPIASHAFAQQRPFLPTAWQNGGTATGQSLEHTSSGWRSYRNGQLFHSNGQVETKSTITENNWLSGGLVCNEIAYSTKTASPNSITVYARPFSAGLLASASQPELAYRSVVTLDLRAGFTAFSAVTSAPVIIRNLTTGNFEIFFTIGSKKIGEDTFYDVKKITWSDHTLANSNWQFTVTDMPETKFLISGYDSAISAAANSVATSMARQCFTGFLHNGEYYLPYISWNGSPRISPATTRQYMLGIVTDNTLAPLQIVNFMSTDPGANVFAFDGTAVRQYVAAMDNFVMPQVYLSELVSAVDLPTPITKTMEDVLRITYQYKLIS